VAGHQRGGRGWQSHGTTGSATCCGRVWKTSSISVIRWWLGQEIDWQFLDQRFSRGCAAGDGRPPLPTRLVAGLLILKHMHNLSDEVLWAGEPVLPMALAKRHDLPLRQSYLRVAKRAALMVVRQPVLHDRLKPVQAAQTPGTRVEVWFQDEARIGQKNRLTRVWGPTGSRPAVPKDLGFASAYSSCAKRRLRN
jgi:hypothetical protein